MRSTIRTILATGAVTAGLLFGAVGTAQAAHEANNKFDLAATAAAPGADGGGRVNYVAGNEGWRNAVQVTGLTPNTSYTWVGIGMGTTMTNICTFTTDASGAGSCTSRVDPTLGRTEIRESATGTVVLRAAGSTDADNTVEDGEIERRGSNRDK